MPYPTVFCIDDLTRDEAVPLHECLYDLVRAPIWHAAALDIAKSPRAGQRHALSAHFRHEDFRAACDLPRRHWGTLHRAVPASAAALLAQALPAQALAIGHAMPPWLQTVLRDAGCAFADLRLSPLAFGPDAFVELHCSNAALAAAVQPFALSAEAVFTEACLHLAAVRRARRATPATACWDDALVFVPQPDESPELLRPDGRFARLEDHASELRHLAGQRRLVCLAGDDAQRHRLSQLLGHEVPVCDLDLQTLLALDDSVAFVGLNVPALQQAAWVGKEVVHLHDAGPATEASALVPAHAFLSEPLWAALLTGAAPRAGAVQLPPRADELRRRLGLAAAPAVAEPLPAGLDLLDIERQRVDALRLEVDGLKDALRLLMRQTALHAALAEPVAA